MNKSLKHFIKKMNKSLKHFIKKMNKRDLIKNAITLKKNAINIECNSQEFYGILSFSNSFHGENLSSNPPPYLL